LSESEILSKETLVRAFITKVCSLKTMPDIKYEVGFFNPHERIYKVLIDRKNDLPSETYIKEKYNFETLSTDLTFTDIIGELDNYYIKEKFAQVIETAITETRKDTNNILEVLDKINQEFNATRSVITKTFDVDLNKDEDKIVEEYIKSGEGGDRILTGFSKFDEHVTAKTGQLMLLCGGSGSGKSYTALRMMSHMIKNGIPCSYMSLEMSLIEVTNRLISLNGLYHFADLYNNRVSPENYRDAVRKVRNASCNIVTRQNEGKINLQTVERHIIDKKPKVCFIDYITLLDGLNISWEAPISPTAEFKRFAMQNDCLLVVLAQADTEANRTGEIPRMTSLRKNKSWADDCDIFLGVSSQKILTDDSKRKISYAVDKSRNGGYSEWSMRANFETGEWFDDYD